MLNLAVLGCKVTAWEFRAFATDLLTQICCCGHLCRDRLQSVTFHSYVMPDWRVHFLKSRRQCVIAQRRMRLEGESRGL